MKIVSINASKTIDAHQVAFNVDAPPAPGVMERVKYGVLSVRFEDNLLQVRSQPNQPTISATVVQTLNEKIAEAENAVAVQSAQFAAKHKRTLDELSKATGLPIE